MKNIFLLIIGCISICSSMTGLCQEDIDFKCINNCDRDATTVSEPNAYMDGHEAFIACHDIYNNDTNACLITANSMLNNYVHAEFSIYNQLINESMGFVMRSLEVIETVEAYALKAHLYYKQGETEAYQLYINKALDLMDQSYQSTINEGERSYCNSFYSVLKPASGGHTLNREQTVHSDRGVK